MLNPVFSYYELTWMNMNKDDLAEYSHSSGGGGGGAFDMINVIGKAIRSQISDNYQ